MCPKHTKSSMEDCLNDVTFQAFKTWVTECDRTWDLPFNAVNDFTVVIYIITIVYLNIYLND